MKLFMAVADNYSYDEYDSAIVSANDMVDVPSILCANGIGLRTPLEVIYIGEYYTDKAEVVLASFNAG